MSERRTVCPKCKASCIETLKVHDYETSHYTAKADFRCCECHHEWEGVVPGRREVWEREQGWVV